MKNEKIKAVDESHFTDFEVLVKVDLNMLNIFHAKKCWHEPVSLWFNFIGKFKLKKTKRILGGKIFILRFYLSFK